MLRVAGSSNFAASFGIRKVAQDVNSDPQDFKGKKGRQGEARKSCKGQLFTHCSIIHWSQKTTLCRRYVKRCATVLEDITLVVEFPEKIDSFGFTSKLILNPFGFLAARDRPIVYETIVQNINLFAWWWSLFKANGTKYFLHCVIACH